MHQKLVSCRGGQQGWAARPTEDAGRRSREAVNVLPRSCLNKQPVKNRQRRRGERAKKA